MGFRRCFSTIYCTEYIEVGSNSKALFNAYTFFCQHRSMKQSAGKSGNSSFNLISSMFVLWHLFDSIDIAKGQHIARIWEFTCIHTDTHSNQTKQRESRINSGSRIRYKITAILFCLFHRLMISLQRLLCQPIIFQIMYKHCDSIKCVFRTVLCSCCCFALQLHYVVRTIWLDAQRCTV